MLQFGFKNVLEQQQHHPAHDGPFYLIIGEPVQVVQLKPEIRDVSGKVIRRAGQQGFQSHSIFRPRLPGVTDQQRDHDGQPAGFFLLLFDMQPPDLDHVFQQLEVHMPVMKAFVLKQQIYEPGTPIT